MQEVKAQDLQVITPAMTQDMKQDTNTDETKHEEPRTQLPQRQQSYRVRQRRDARSRLGFLFYKLVLLIMQLVVLIVTWNAEQCNNMQVMNLVIFILLVIPGSWWQKLPCVFFLWCFTWPIVLIWGQAQWASSHSTCNELLSMWTLVLLIAFLYIPLVIIFIAVTSTLIDVCQEALQIPRAIAALQTYLAPQKKRSENECCICTSEYKNEDNLTRLACNHEFHTDCIVPLLQQHPHNSCPICSKLPENDTAILIHE